MAMTFPCIACPAIAHAQSAGHLIELIDVAERPDHVNITVQFGCSMRYLSHLPASSGSETTFRFKPGLDCGLGQFPTAVNEQPSIAGAEAYLQAADLEAGAPGEVNVVLSWRRPVDYVVAPIGGQRGFVVRLIEKPGKAQAWMQDASIPAPNYAVNLESHPAPFSPEELSAASSRFGLPAYDSSTQVDGVTWHRLRVGPVSSRKDAEALLALALSGFPRAWLVIGEDEDRAQPVNVSLVLPPPAAGAVPDAPLSDAERAGLLADARSALAAREFAHAVESLTSLVRQPEYRERAQAQELLGLARERAGQLAQAKAEYEEYLRRYPKGEGAERIRARIRALALAGRDSAAPRPHQPGAANGWSASGGVSQLYRRDQENVSAAGTQFDQTAQGALVNNGDFLTRRRGDTFDFLGRLYAGYTKYLGSAGGVPGSLTQVNAAFVELTDKDLGLSGRLGRQVRGTDGVFGTFDGAWLSYRIQPKLSINATFGSPVDSVNEGVRTNRQFAGLSATLGTFAQSWDLTGYILEQRFSGLEDRRAVGLESRYFSGGRSFIALIDYDVYFRQLNSATLIGTLTLPASFNFSFDIDHRETPILTLRNALIGQPVTTLDSLLVNFTPLQIEQLARDRTACSDVLTATLARPIGERFQLSADLYLTRIGATPASGNVPATPASGLDRTVQLQWFGSGLFVANDIHVLSLRYETNPMAVTESVGLSSRMPLWHDWRLGPRLRLDRILYSTDQSSQLALVPSLRVERWRGKLLIEFEAGADFGRRELQNTLDNQSSRGYFVSLGYRLGF